MDDDALLASKINEAFDAADRQEARRLRQEGVGFEEIGTRLCDIHRRQVERERSRKRAGGLTRGPHQAAIDARDADPNYRPTRRQP
jgi:hypothetical protein